jgi:hypothetical protein
MNVLFLLCRMSYTCILFVNNLYVHPLISLHASDFGTSKTDPKSLFSTLSSQSIYTAQFR